MSTRRLWWDARDGSARGSWRRRAAARRRTSQGEEREERSASVPAIYPVALTVNSGACSERVTSSATAAGCCA